MSEQSPEVPETYAFTCGTCGYGWQATFELLFFTDALDPAGGTTQEYVDEAGRAVRSPLTDAVCPRCGGRRVRVDEPGQQDRSTRVGHEGPDRPAHHLHLPHRPRHRPEDAS
ncbi:hypothetical protein ACIQOU_27230 [Streptomyces sp. NPDC091279]|uniref:hypothetical protein n=1 Tax=unclassified Streptomyces TaxID=2593676 RepID=UPI0037F822A4